MRNEQLKTYFTTAMEKQLKKIKTSREKKVPFMEFFIDVGKINNLIRETLK